MMIASCAGTIKYILSYQNYNYIINQHKQPVNRESKYINFNRHQFGTPHSLITYL